MSNSYKWQGGWWETEKSGILLQVFFAGFRDVDFRSATFRQSLLNNSRCFRVFTWTSKDIINQDIFPKWALIQVSSAYKKYEHSAQNPSSLQNKLLEGHNFCKGRRAHYAQMSSLLLNKLYCWHTFGLTFHKSISLRSYDQTVNFRRRFAW